MIATAGRADIANAVDCLAAVARFATAGVEAFGSRGILGAMSLDITNSSAADQPSGTGLGLRGGSFGSCDLGSLSSFPGLGLSGSHDRIRTLGRVLVAKT